MRAADQRRNTLALRAARVIPCPFCACLSKTVAVIATLDTKGEEAAFLRDRIQAAGVQTLLIDAGVFPHSIFSADVQASEVAAAAQSDLQALRSAKDRGKGVTVMAAGATAIVRQLFGQGAIHGVVSLGGSAGTTIGTAAMRALPVGFPKLMVSTLASGDTKPYVATKDICMMYSVLDIAGLNSVLRGILCNAAGAICGMVSNVQPPINDAKPAIAASMFGVTTPCVTAARLLLESKGFEVLVFHATGSGGQAMEQLIEDGAFQGVLDLTTTELADELVGGVLSAGPHRLEAAGRRSIPQVVCPGAIDMVNFGPLETVPNKFQGRNLYVHNPSVTLMRTTPDECAMLGRVTAEKLNAACGPVTVLIPLQGVSAIDKVGAPFYSPDALAAYRVELKAALRPGIPLLEIDAHINDEIFARSAVETLLETMRRTS
jgi:uncharacterized protein (UPF0261 family)